MLVRENDKPIEVSLRIFRKYLYEIIDGKMKEEWRDLIPFYASRFCYLDKNGIPYEFKNIVSLKLYDQHGYWLRVECKPCVLIFENEIPEGFEKGDMVFCFMLGDILEKSSKFE